MDSESLLFPPFMESFPAYFARLQNMQGKQGMHRLLHVGVRSLLLCASSSVNSWEWHFYIIYTDIIADALQQQ